MTNQPEPPGEPQDEPASIIQTIRDEISQAFDTLFKSGRADVIDDADARPKAGGDPAKPPPVDVEGQMKSAMSAVLEEDKRKTAEQTELQALKDELAALKASIEKAPEEERKVEKFMGWRI